MVIIAVTNQKGGIGKSTTAHQIGAGLSIIKGKKVLLIDLDPQANLTIATGAKMAIPNAYDVITRKAEAKETIQPIKNKLDIIPATDRLSKVAVELTRQGKEFRLKEALSPVTSDYDVIVIDTPPALGILTINALTVADKLIIPAQADLFSNMAIKALASTIEAVKEHANPDLMVEGILLTRYQSRSILTQEMTEVIDKTAQMLMTKVFKARIREAIAVKEAQAMHDDIFTYSPKSKVAADYKNFLAELEV